MDPKNTNTNPLGTTLGSTPQEPVVSQAPVEPAVPVSNIGAVNLNPLGSEEPTAPEPVSPVSGVPSDPLTVSSVEPVVDSVTAEVAEKPAVSETAEAPSSSLTEEEPPAVSSVSIPTGDTEEPEAIEPAVPVGVGGTIKTEL